MIYQYMMDDICVYENKHILIRMKEIGELHEFSYKIYDKIYKLNYDIYMSHVTCI